MQNMNVELVAQMFKNYQSNVLFHLEGESDLAEITRLLNSDIVSSYGQPQRAILAVSRSATTEPCATNATNFPSSGR